MATTLFKYYYCETIPYTPSPDTNIDLEYRAVKVPTSLQPFTSKSLTQSLSSEELGVEIYVTEFKYVITQSLKNIIFELPLNVILQNQFFIFYFIF